MVEKYIDEIDARIAGEEWLETFVEKVKDNPSAEMQRHHIENNNGVVSTLWADNEVVAMYVTLRDEYNWTQLIKTEL